jgi:hypothetical protein
VEGLQWGFLFLGVITPIVGFFFVARVVRLLLDRFSVPEAVIVEDEDFEFDEMLDFDSEVVEEKPQVDVRYVPSTIVRPPNVVRRDEIDDDED